MPANVISDEEAEVTAAEEMPFFLLSPQERQRQLTAIATAAQARLEQARQNPPEWVRNLRPATLTDDGTNGLHRLVGAWPGDESDVEIEEALARLS